MTRCCNTVSIIGMARLGCAGRGRLGRGERGHRGGITLGTIGNTAPLRRAGLVIGTNNMERMRILTTNGYWAWAPPSAEQLDVNGGMRVYTTIAQGNLLGTTGVVRYTTTSPNTTNNYHDGYQSACCRWASAHRER
jgi:hypothetical protein